MNSLDTNVLARFFIDDTDDPQAMKQRPAAMLALTERSFISITVMLEFEWVMRGFYQMTRVEITNVFNALVGIAHITVEDRAEVLGAIDAYQQGLDFGDALHLAKSARCTKLVSFDKAFAKRAKALGLLPPVALLD
jgi:predicted nucleic-acid-binding protein